MKAEKRAVLISEPHLYDASARYGGHQYAKVFARYGWKVILISSSFNIMRLALRSSKMERKYIQLWRNRGVDADDGVRNYSLAHVLPTQLRFRKPFRVFSHLLFVPTLRNVMRSEGLSNVDLLWLHGDCDWLLRKGVDHSKLLIRIIDDYSGFKNGKKRRHPMMIRTLRAADGVVSCTSRVRELYSDLIENIKVVPNGVDYQHFSREKGNEPDFVRSIPRPRVIYVGAIAEWFDFPLVCQLADRFPALSFILCGHWTGQVPKIGSYPSNIHITGPVRYDDVPDLFAYSDVGLIPFKYTDLVLGVSPIKAYEYLASCLPVVSLRWPELAGQSLPIFLAKGVEEFERGISESLSMPKSERCRLREAVKGCSWENRLRSILDHIGLDL